MIRERTVEGLRATCQERADKRENTKMKNLKLWFSAAAIAATAPNIAVAECGEVSVTEMTFSSAIITTEIATFLMEQGYGCTVTRVSGGRYGPPFFLLLKGITGIQEPCLTATTSISTSHAGFAKPATSKTERVGSSGCSSVPKY